MFSLTIAQKRAANKHLKDLETTKGIREAIGDALRKYMSCKLIYRN